MNNLGYITAPLGPKFLKNHLISFYELDEETKNLFLEKTAKLTKPSQYQEICYTLYSLIDSDEYSEEDNEFFAFEDITNACMSFSR